MLRHAVGVRTLAFGLTLNTDKSAGIAPFLWMQQDEKTANRGWDYPQPER
ncbi:hypothetical protein KCP77_21850 [Salmonella enterica subsp. enterica]|nr:hypothetical protein KCP77_21850 [Salmonella enterica subsp. enterica]